MKDPVQSLADSVTSLARAVEDLGRRVLALEALRADLERRSELVHAASRSWRALLRAQTDLVLASDAGVVARVPVTLARLVAAGRALDVEVREVDSETVELVDVHGRVAAALPRAALLALPRVLSQPDAGRLLGLGVQVQRGQTGETSP